MINRESKESGEGRIDRQDREEGRNRSVEGETSGTEVAEVAVEII